jgi:hypothetical protein
MYEVRATHDEESHPRDRVTGPWTYATAMEIATSMNRDDEQERSVTDDTQSTDQ